MRYKALADFLAQQIAEGKLKPRARLPSEPEMAIQYGVSRVTVRSALAVLERDGLVTRRPGAGTFVGMRRAGYGITLNQFADLFAHDTGTRTVELLAFGPFEGEDAAALGGRAVRVDRLWRADGLPFALTKGFVHRDVAIFSAEDAQRRSGAEMLDAVNRPIARARVKFRAALARGFGALLEIKESSPVLVLERTGYAADGQPVEISQCYLPGDAADYVIDLDGAQRPIVEPLLRSLDGKAEEAEA